MLGLSATLDRKDGLRKVFEWFIGKQVLTHRRVLSLDRRQVDASPASEAELDVPDAAAVKETDELLELLNHAAYADLFSYLDPDLQQMLTRGGQGESARNPKRGPASKIICVLRAR